MNNENFVSALGSIITNYRKQSHPELSSKKFADKCGVAKTVIRDIETQKHTGNPCHATLEKIAKGLDLESSFELQELIKNYNNETKLVSKDEDNPIILQPNTKLYALVNLIKNWDDEHIDTLHNIVKHLK